MKDLRKRIARISGGSSSIKIVLSSLVDELENVKKELAELKKKPKKAPAKKTD